MGDGVLIYFGYPQAHEDDAERSVRAGLAVIEDVAKLSGRVTLQVRIGIATGLAVVGDLIGVGAAQERGVVGETPNLAARVQGLAEPNTIVIADGTRRQVGGLFDLADLGPKTLAGFAEPQHAWRVIGESGVLSRFEALRSGSAPLVGRDEEFELLMRRWARAKSGEGQVVLLSGEPGIGKSRMTATVLERLGQEPHTRLRYFCSPHFRDSALWPVIAQIERAAGFERDDAEAVRLEKLAALTAPATQDAIDFALLSELLSLPGAADALNLSPARKREKLFDAVLGLLEAEARKRPVLMVFEDAHWIDPTSRELLDLTIDRIRQLPVLLLITFRPEFQSHWGGRAHVSSLVLNRLGERDGETMVRSPGGQRGTFAGDHRGNRRTYRRRAAVRRGTDQGGAGKRRSVPGGSDGGASGRARGARDPPCGAHGAPGSPRSHRQGNRRDRRGAGPRVRLRTDRGGGTSSGNRVANRPGSTRRRANCCFAGERRRTRRTCSNMRWCRTPPTAHCCGDGGRNSTVAPRRRWSGISPILSSASRNFWPIIAPARAKPKRRWRNG